MDIHNDVILSPWQESWHREFHLEKQCLIGILQANEHDVEIFHVGSTSVKGMISKPIIDILICPDDKTEPGIIASELEGFGYRNLGECGRPGRFFLSSGDEPGKTFYVHVCHKSHQVAQDQLLFQKLLRTSPEIFKGYFHLKLVLADAFPEARFEYREAKGAYVNGILSAYRLGNHSDSELAKREGTMETGL